MANPQGYPPQGYQDQTQYAQGEAQQFDGTQTPAAPAPGAAKKKRAYAGQAFDYGAGANTGAAAGAAPSTPAYGAATPAYGFPGQQPGQQAFQQPAGYQAPAYGQPQAAQPAAQQAYGQPQQYDAPQGGYQPPAQGGVAGMTQQFGQMGMGAQQQQPPQQPAAAPGTGMARLNPLQPVDITMQGQPFHVSDLDLLPPPLILPPNASHNNLNARLLLTISSQA